jgi:hypothetical protein
MVEIHGIPPIRKEREWMGHGAFVGLEGMQKETAGPSTPLRFTQDDKRKNRCWE